MALGGKDGGITAGGVVRLEGGGGGVPRAYPLGEDPEVVAVEVDGVGDSVAVSPALRVRKGRRHLRAEEPHDFILDDEDGPFIIRRGFFLLFASIS